MNALKLLAAAAVALMAPHAASAQAFPGLPNAPGHETVGAVCLGCHQPNLITRSSGYTRGQWQELIGTMIDLSGNTEALDTILGYLEKQFPPNTQRASKLVPGEARIRFQEWTTPTLGQRTRDPVEAPDGSIWWAGQYGNLIGRIDPRTGEMREYELPPRSLPHSINIDANGTPWFTGNGNGTIGKVDPVTGKVTVYRMPDPAARDPHTAEFDRDGILWFTLQQSDMVGRLDPKTGDIKLAKARQGTRPYGLKIAADGTPWFSCNGGNCLVKVDRETMALTEIKLPIPETTVRRLDLAADGSIWYVNSSQGRLGHYDPKSGNIREWASPSGPSSHPYAIAVVDGIVWYNESGTRPDALVRFDPRTETFQSWAVPSGGVTAGIVRHMRPTRDGDLLIHQSSTNRVLRVHTRDPQATR